MESTTPLFIEKTPFKEPSEDFDFLVAKGIELLQKLTGTVWTDYNLHDPGVTILEQLCFAFTDLSYRTGFDITDILTNEKGEIERVKNLFFDKKSILSTNPTTPSDYRKVILDEVEEVYNVDVLPVLSPYASSYARGVYEIRVKLKDYLSDKQKTDSHFIAEVEAKIRKAVVSKRNIGENFLPSMVFLTPQTITIHADILIEEFSSPEEVLLQIYLKIQKALSPQVRFYSEWELLEKKIPIEEIYEGPLLKQGILPDSELKDMVSEIDVFKLIGVVSSAKGVLLVQSFVVHDEAGNDAGHLYSLAQNAFPVLDPETFVDTIKLYAGDYKLAVSKKEFLELYTKSLLQNLFKSSESRHTKNDDTITAGKYRNLSEYTSIQENFPHIYGLGKYGVFANEAADRKAQVKQLRAYIFFFEQVLANYLSQLANINGFFSPQLEEEKYSYYFKPLYDIRGAKELLGGQATDDEWEDFKKDTHNPYITCLANEQETVTDYRRRKHKAFEHLYARFNETFINYPINAYISNYGDLTEGKAGRVLQWKASLLKQFADTEYHRVQAFNYLQDKRNIGGFEKKIRRLLYIQNEDKLKLSEIFDTGKIAFVSGKINEEWKDISGLNPQLVNWNNENLKIISDADDIIEPGELGKLLGGGINQRDAFFFRQEGITVLKHGINYENYRIGPSSKNENEVIIVYRKPTQELWRTISVHPDMPSAEAALDKLIKYLTKLSIESEGFHCVEHLLLSPALTAKAFGFRFQTAKDKVVFQNTSWTSFADREAQLNELLAFAKNKSGATVKEPIIRDASLINEAKKVIEDVKSYAAGSGRPYPSFDMLVRSYSGVQVREAFFDSQVTVVLPSWPARFQDPEFKVFVENLFNSAGPAHLKFNFQWLGVKKMKAFEHVYFQWLQALKDETGLPEISEKLAILVGRNDYLVNN